MARLEAWNQPIHRIRGRIEKIFGTWKRSYGVRRMRWGGFLNVTQLCTGAVCIWVVMSRDADKVVDHDDNQFESPTLST